MKQAIISEGTNIDADADVARMKQINRLQKAYDGVHCPKCGTLTDRRDYGAPDVDVCGSCGWRHYPPATGEARKSMKKDNRKSANLKGRTYGEGVCRCGAIFHKKSACQQFHNIDCRKFYNGQ
jgi:hypothetical protein